MIKSKKYTSISKEVEAIRYYRYYGDPPFKWRESWFEVLAFVKENMIKARNVHKVKTHAGAGAFNYLEIIERNCIHGDKVEAGDWLVFDAELHRLWTMSDDDFREKYHEPAPEPQPLGKVEFMEEVENKLSNVIAAYADDVTLTEQYSSIRDNLTDFVADNYQQPKVSKSTVEAATLLRGVVVDDLDKKLNQLRNEKDRLRFDLDSTNERAHDTCKELDGKLQEAMGLLERFVNKFVRSTVGNKGNYYCDGMISKATIEATRVFLDNAPPATVSPTPPKLNPHPAQREMMKSRGIELQTAYPETGKTLDWQKEYYGKEQ